MDKNWRLPNAYTYVVEPSAFAWEFLRRSPDYGADFQSIVNGGRLLQFLSAGVTQPIQTCVRISSRVIP
jgi:hypothetical protein